MIHRILATLALALFALAGQAQSLTTGQQATVRAFACADTGTARQYVTGGDTTNLRAWLNAAGSYIVWRTNVTNDELGDAMNGTEAAMLAQLDALRADSAFGPLAEGSPT